jgi:AraC-like DNA-binding protein
VHFGDPLERLEADGRVARQPRAIYAGQLSRALSLRPAGRVATLGVRFHSDGAAALMGIPQHELTDRTPAMDVIAGGLARLLAEVLDACADPRQALGPVQSRLMPFAVRAAPDTRVRFAVDAIMRRRGHVDIDRLARAAGLSRRHLERRFLDVVGLTPKRLARTVRFQHAVGVLERAAPRGACTTTAALCGYADQAHFVRDFRDFAGSTPGAHLIRCAELTGFFRDPLA